MYAAVDMSKKKKKKNRSASEEKLEQTEYLNVSDLPEYSVVNKPKKPKPVAPYIPPASKTTAIELVEKSDQSELPTKSTSKDNSVSADHEPAKSKSKHLLVLVIVLAVFFALAFLVCLIVSVVALSTTSRLRSDIELFRDEIESLQNQLHNDTVNNQTQIFDEERIEQLLISILSVGRSEQTPATSCAEIHPFSPSGYYWVRASNGSVVRVYCDMTLSCGNITGGWMRVAELNTINSCQQCPDGLMERDDGRCAGRTANGCSSVFFSTQKINYTNVCGRITAYQVGTTNAFGGKSDPTIDSNYVDGVSLTHGSSTRQHIWTFAVGLDRTGTFDSPGSYCPCQNTTLASIAPSFVGENYFCDAGNEEFMGTGTGSDNNLQSDPLWDGTDCLCCDNPPWFYQQLPQPTTDNIEMRVCRNENNENIAIEVVNIYVQ